jgi:pyruvate/2-oxoglutarate dehydrogenase complex dihydrolipoamide dehydrogenase (E3) component
MIKTYDAIIIGTGQAGPFLAQRLAGAGMKVAIIERKLFGGTCINTGCTPTKTMVASAYAAHTVSRAADFGVINNGAASVDMTLVKARKDAISGQSRTGVESWLRGMANCSVYQGHALLESPTEVSVGAERLTADRIFINVGGRAVVPQMPGIAEVPYLTNISIMDVDFLPRHLVIVGGGYIGLEFAQMYRRFGSEVTIIEMAPHLAQHEDEDVSSAIQSILEREGIHVRTNATCIGFSKRGDHVLARVDCVDGDPEVSGSHVLLAVGRRPNTDDLGLTEAGVAVDKRGYIVVDDQLHTSVPGIWALGDCNGRGAFTHTAFNDAEIVGANLLDNDPRKVSDRITAYALYIDPPLGRAGLTEAEVRKTGRRALIGRRPMTKVGRAVEKGETQGFMKIMVDAQTHEILGAAILGTGGDEAIHSILDVMYARAPYTTIQRAVHIHPTVSELIPTMLGELQPLSDAAELRAVNGAGGARVG